MSPTANHLLTTDDRAGKAVREAIQFAHDTGTNVRKRPLEISDNTFAADLEKSGFLKEI